MMRVGLLQIEVSIGGDQISWLRYDKNCLPMI